VISATDKIASLFVPTGVKALDANGNPLSEISITAIGSADLPPIPTGAAYTFAGYAYETGPNGATFEPGITLSLELPEDDWNALDLDDRTLAVKWYNKQTSQWEDVPTTVFQSMKSVDAEITHFSTYALFTEPVTTTPPTDTETPTTPTTPAEEPPAEGISMTMILLIIIIIAIIVAAGYYFMTKK
jgi:ABC-type Na+ efflux pump permease subunit